MDQRELDQRSARCRPCGRWSSRPTAQERTRRSAALAGLTQRYSGAVNRYLLGAVRDPDTANELSQEFALRLLQGAFRRHEPGRGRFRDYLRTALINLVNDHHARQRARPRPLPADEPERPEPSGSGPQSDAAFLESWREELLARTWKALAVAQPMYHAVLLFHVENPEANSPQVAERVGAQLGTPLKPDRVRKAIQRSHARFAELLVDEVAASLENPSPEELAEELRELDLLKYCRSALEKRS